MQVMRVVIQGSSGPGVCVPFSMILQGTYGNLCWASVTDGVRAHYHDFGAPGLDRWCSLVSKVLPVSKSACLMCKPQNKKCNKSAVLEKTLSVGGVGGQPTPGLLAFKDIVAEVRKGRVIVVRRKGSPKHARVAIGVIIDDDNKARVVIADPAGTVSAELYDSEFITNHDQSFLTQTVDGVQPLPLTSYPCAWGDILRSFTDILDWQGISPYNFSIGLAGVEAKLLGSSINVVSGDLCQSILRNSLRIDFDGASGGIPVNKTDWKTLQPMGADGGKMRSRHFVVANGRPIALVDAIQHDGGAYIADVSSGTNVEHLIDGLRSVSRLQQESGLKFSLSIFELEGMQISALVLRRSDWQEALVTPVGPDFASLEAGKFYSFKSFESSFLEIRAEILSSMQDVD